MRALLLLIVLAGPAASPLLAQTQGASPPRSFNLDVQTVDPGLSRRFAGLELIRDIDVTVGLPLPIGRWNAKLGTRPENLEFAKAGLTRVVGIAVGQQQRLEPISGIVKKVIASIGTVEPNMDRLVAALQKRYPDLDFNDPQVLKVVRKSIVGVADTMSGLMVEPSSVALFALVEPDLAVRSQLLSLKTQLARRGDWDPPGNVRLQEKIAELERVTAASYESEDLRLIALQNALKDQGIPIPNTMEGGQLLVEKMFSRFSEVLDGKNLPITVSGIEEDPSGLYAKFLTRFDERIAKLEAQAANAK